MGEGYGRDAKLISLAVGDDPMACQMDIEATAGSYAGERPFGRAANLPQPAPQTRRHRHRATQLRGDEARLRVAR
jgi:hypothetical protein